MQYEGPIYRPPSEADSVLVQATVGCPHNRCTFCMVYKNGPAFKVRPVAHICRDLDEARQLYGPGVKTLFFPAGNTMAMPADHLSAICRYAHGVFPNLERITVYGSSAAIDAKGPVQLKRLADAGLSRIHVGLESGDDAILKKIRKGTTSAQQIRAGRAVRDAGIELSLYVILGIGGQAHSRRHADATARVLNAIGPDFIRLRTFVPKVNTPLLAQVQSGEFKMLGPHGVLAETAQLVRGLDLVSHLASDHYTNYLDLRGQLPQCRPSVLAAIEKAMARPESSFRPFFIGTA